MINNDEIWPGALGCLAQDCPRPVEHARGRWTLEQAWLGPVSHPVRLATMGSEQSLTAITMGSWCILARSAVSRRARIHDYTTTRRHGVVDATVTDASAMDDTAMDATAKTKPFACLGPAKARCFQHGGEGQIGSQSQA